MTGRSFFSYDTLCENLLQRGFYYRAPEDSWSPPDDYDSAICCAETLRAFCVEHPSMVDAAHDLLIRGLGFEVSVKTFGFTTIVKLQPRIRALPDGTFARPVDPVRADADIIKYPILSPLELLALQAESA